MEQGELDAENCSLSYHEVVELDTENLSLHYGRGQVLYYLDYETKKRCCCIKVLAIHRLDYIESLVIFSWFISISLSVLTLNQFHFHLRFHPNSRCLKNVYNSIFHINQILYLQLLNHEDFLMFINIFCLNCNFKS